MLCTLYFICFSIGYGPTHASGGVEFDHFWRLAEVKEVVQVLQGLICTRIKELGALMEHKRHLELFVSIWSHFMHIGGV